MYPILFRIGVWNIRASFVFLVLAILAGILFNTKEAERVGFSRRDINTYLIAIIPFAL